MLMLLTSNAKNSQLIFPKNKKKQTISEDNDVYLLIRNFSQTFIFMQPPLFCSCFIFSIKFHLIVMHLKEEFISLLYKDWRHRIFVNKIILLLLFPTSTCLNQFVCFPVRSLKIQLTCGINFKLYSLCFSMFNLQILEFITLLYFFWIWTWLCILLN